MLSLRLELIMLVRENNAPSMWTKNHLETLLPLVCKPNPILGLRKYYRRFHRCQGNSMCEIMSLLHFAVESAKQTNKNKLKSVTV